MNQQMKDGRQSLAPRQRSAAHCAQSTPPRAPAPSAGEALRVLVVDDDTASAATLVRQLSKRGYLARSVATGGQALRAHDCTDLILLDLDITDSDGFDVCRGIRAMSDIPIIAVTEREAELDRVLGLQAGADDCMVKPYGIHELLARIAAVMRRARPARGAQTIEHGPLLIDAFTRKASVHGQPVRLTRKEFDLLHVLAIRAGTVVSRRELMTQVWGDPWPPQGRTLDTHVSSLRGKLGSSDWVLAVRGIGFCLGNP
jgi:DNA-binding response OmpR family regulator